jgi:hypothetical protein
VVDKIIITPFVSQGYHLCRKSSDFGKTAGQHSVLQKSFGKALPFGLKTVYNRKEKCLFVPTFGEARRKA